MASGRKQLPSKFSTPQALSRKASYPSKDLLGKVRLTGRIFTQSLSSPASPGSNSPPTSLTRTKSLLTVRTGDLKSNPLKPLPDVIRTPYKFFVRVPQQLGDSPLVRKGHTRSMTESLPSKVHHSRSDKSSSTPLKSTPSSETFENVVTRCAFKTRTGTIAYRPKKHNQDSYVISPHLAQTRGQYLFAVCDGHGTKGHEVSTIIKESLPIYVAETLPSKALVDDPQVRLGIALRGGLAKVTDMVYRSKVDVTFSGSTCVATLISGKSLICANVGDSRAILVRREGKRWTFEALSIDQKPDLYQEKQRIEKSGGRVSPFREANGVAVGPPRVWRGDDDIPGLAMSRSIGDLVACQAGVIPDPELKYVELSFADKAIVLASDGLWEFMDSQEVAEMVGGFWEQGNLEGTCDRLLREAVLRWKAEDEVVDDITVIVAHLQVPS